jgi:hypothetical protein
MLALVQAAAFVRAHGRFQPGSADRILEKFLQLALAIRRAAASRALWLTLVGADE